MERLRQALEAEEAERLRQEQEADRTKFVVFRIAVPDSMGFRTPLEGIGVDIRRA